MVVREVSQGRAQAVLVGGRVDVLLLLVVAGAGGKVGDVPPGDVGGVLQHDLHRVT